MSAAIARPVVYTPDNEPYLGRASVFHLDTLIHTCLRLNADVAPLTYQGSKTIFQEAACHLIPQSISITLSIRELVRQGYLFGALVLVRPLAERTVILYYLHKYPAKVDLWARGWPHTEAPSLATMSDQLGKGDARWQNLGATITRPLNSITHGKPDSAQWSLIDLGEGNVAHGVSKLLDHPPLCDKVCDDTASWLLMIYIMMDIVFSRPDAPTGASTAPELSRHSHKQPQ